MWGEDKYHNRGAEEMMQDKKFKNLYGAVLLTGKFCFLPFRHKGGLWHQREI